MRLSRSLVPLLGFGVAATALAAVALVATASQDRGAGTVRQAVPAARAIADAPSRVDYRRLEGRIALLMQQRGMVGLAVGAVEGGRVRYLKGFGETVAQSGGAVTPDTVFRWASVSKGVASALVTLLAQDGKLSLDTPVADLGTTLTVPPGGGRVTVTVTDVLSHRLGLVRNAWDERLEAGEDPRQLRRQLGTLPAYCPPATCYAYQNIGYDAAAEIVEHATGERYAAVARARLFAPLGMTRTSIGQAGLERAQSWARPHHGRVAVTVNDAYYRVPAAGGVNSSIRDLARWMQAQMGEAPTVLNAAALYTMHRPRVRTPPHGPRGAMDRALTDASYGLGWRSFRYAGHALVGHRGSVDGYGSLVLFDPARRSGIVMLWNSNDYRAARLQLEFFDMLYGLPFTDWLDLPSTGAPRPR